MEELYLENHRIGIKKRLSNDYTRYLMSCIKKIGGTSLINNEKFVLFIFAIGSLLPVSKLFGSNLFVVLNHIYYWIFFIKLQKSYVIPNKYKLAVFLIFSLIFFALRLREILELLHVMSFLLM